MTIATVSIKFKAGTYSVFRNLQNKPWHAIGEYVDNAVQSYEDHKEELRSSASGYQFRVAIDINWELREMRIFDNAAGISEKNFSRAFEPANIPVNNAGLHEFGMGMKTASIWLAEVWIVRTAALGESLSRTVEFDLQKVLREESEVLGVVSAPKQAGDHFTEITLKGLTGNAPSPYNFGKVKNHLASIYRRYIRTGELELYINGELLTYRDPEILNVPATTDPEGRSILWKKEIDFSMGKYHARGFVGLLNELSTSINNGFSLFRRGRVIEGSHDEKYRPKILSGHEGSPRYKRLFGELELEGFDVSFNKGSFQETAEIEALMEAIKVELTAKDFNLLKQGDDYRKGKGKEESAKVAKTIVDKIRTETKDKPLDAAIEASLEDTANKELDENNTRLESSTKVVSSHTDEINIKGETYRLRMEMITEPSISNLYNLVIEHSDTYTKSAVFKINMSHPFFGRFDNFESEEDYKPIILMIRALVIAELYAPSEGARSPGIVRKIFNNVLKNL